VGKFNTSKNGLPEEIKVEEETRFLLFPKNPESKFHYIEYPYAERKKEGIEDLAIDMKKWLRDNCPAITDDSISPTEESKSNMKGVMNKILDLKIDELEK